MNNSNRKYIGFGGLTFVRCTGAEYVAFHKDFEIWPDGRLIIQMVNRIDGEWMPDDLKLDDIPPAAVIEISDQGDVFDEKSLELWNIIDYFCIWKSKQ